MKRRGRTTENKFGNKSKNALHTGQFYLNKTRMK